MTVYVLRNGKLTVKGENRAVIRHGFPLPMISRFEAFDSPVTGETVSSWRERERDMDAVGACDRRDLPRAPFEKREQENARRTDDTDFQWRD